LTGQEIPALFQQKRTTGRDDDPFENPADMGRLVEKEETYVKRDRSAKKEGPKNGREQKGRKVNPDCPITGGRQY